MDSIVFDDVMLAFAGIEVKVHGHNSILHQHNMTRGTIALYAEVTYDGRGFFDIYFDKESGYQWCECHAYKKAYPVNLENGRCATPQKCFDRGLETLLKKYAS